MPSPDRPLTAAIALAAATHRGTPAERRQAGLATEEALGPGSARQVLRLLHLFFGFPRALRAMQDLRNLLPPAAEEDPAADPDAGEMRFRALYGPQAEAVLTHLAELDPVFRRWILDHAYGRAIERPGLSLAESERLAVLCLAATACWKQWESHRAIACRLGVRTATLRDDLTQAAGWPAEPERQEALRRLSQDHP